MTEQRLEYAKGLLEQKRNAEKDRLWVMSIPEDSKLTRRDIDNLKRIAFDALQSLLGYLTQEFKQL